MKTLRRVHLYLGCFFAPLLLFYVATGWYQTLHENRNKSLGEQDNWISKLSSIHVDQVYPTKAASSYSPQFFRFFVVLMCVALIVTVGLGIYLAFRTTRKAWPVWLSLGLGIVLPAILLRLGQHH